MFKLKKTKIHDTNWKTFNSIEKPPLIIGDIIKMRESSGTYKVIDIVRKEVGSYRVFIDVIIPKVFPTRNQNFELYQGQEYRIIGKS